MNSILPANYIETAYLSKEQAEEFVEKHCKEQLFIGKWIPVSEKLPTDEQEVLFVFKNHIYKGYYSSGDWETDANEIFTRKHVITYWMPVPELPKEDIK